MQQPNRMQQAYDQILEQLVTGDLPPGARLVNRALGEEFGLSTVTVREAIHRLASEGVIEHIPGAGAFVRKLGRRDVVQLYAFRSSLDRFALTELIGRIDAFQLSWMKQLIEEWSLVAHEIKKSKRQMATGKLYERWLDCDLRFHSLLIDAADNPWLRKTFQDLDLMARIGATKSRQISLSDAAWTWLMHARLVRAIGRRDLARALEVLEHHNQDGLQQALKRAEL